MADGQVVFEITGDPKSINQTVKQVTSNIQSESKKWDQAAGEATGGIEKSFSGMAGKIVATLTAAGIGSILLSWGKAAIDAASDLAEVQNVVDTVFGDGASQIEAWAKKAGQQFGLTETQAKKFTSTLGAMMKSSGLAGNEIVDMSTDLAGLAADMASFYNLDFETAFEKIRSGISGETMPLKQLGINMSVANLNAFALAQGLEKTFDQMDQGEQTMLRYQYLMQATSDAQGDFAKTADGFANAQRRIESSIDSIKTSVGNVLLPWVEKAVGGIAGFLSEISEDMLPERTVMDAFNDINVDTAGKMGELQQTYDTAKAIIDVMAEIESKTVTLSDGSTKTFGDLFADLGEVEASGGDIRAYLQGLGVDVESVVTEYRKWREGTKELTSLVPSLTNVINEETGAIDGGTEAVQRNLDEWKAAQEKKLAWAAYYAKAQALEEARSEQYKYQFTAEAKNQLRKNFEAEHQELARLYKEKGGLIFRDYSDWGISKDEAEAYMNIVKESSDAEKEATRQAEAFANAEEELTAGKQALIEKYGEEEQAVEEATKAVAEWSDETKAAGKEALAAAESALKALADYVQGVKDSTEQAVNSVVKGFEKVGKAGDDLRTKQDDLGKEYSQATKDYASEIKSLQKKFGENWIEEVDKLSKTSDAWNNLSDKEKEAYNTLAKLKNEQHEVNQALDQYKPEGMMKNLESQKQFMEEYLANLQKAQEMGLSSDMLGSLSDGSKESAEYLAGLVEAGPEAAMEVSNLYDELQEQKKGFVDALADQKLAADETYDALVQKAIESVAELNLGGEAEAAMADTVEGLAQGIADNIGDVKAAVDAIEEQLNRLSSFGFSFDLSSGIDFVGSLFHPHETGLNYVPFDGYLAQLHEGEGILTAEENRVWQRFRNGEASHANIDYDSLGSVMRDNVHAGGDVYLDGRTVGKVVSGMQGNQYRSLQRSGWQQ
jgi:hypothetical protein